MDRVFRSGMLHAKIWYIFSAITFIFFPGSQPMATYLMIAAIYDDLVPVPKGDKRYVNSLIRDQFIAIIMLFIFVAQIYELRGLEWLTVTFTGIWAVCGIYMEYSNPILSDIDR
jgi:hypothetical protein